MPTSAANDASSDKRRHVDQGSTSAKGPKRGKASPANRYVADVFLRRGRRALEKIAATASAKQLAEFADARTDAEVVLRALGAGLLAELKDDPLAAARLRGLRMQKDLLRAAESLTSREFADALGITPQAVNKGRRTGAYIGLPVGEQFLYPYIQVKDGRVVRGLKETLAALHVASSWAALAFLMGEDAALGTRPIDALKGGRIPEAVAAATRYGEHGAP